MKTPRTLFTLRLQRTAVAFCVVLLLPLLAAAQYDGGQGRGDAMVAFALPLIDCEGVIEGSALPGTACDDANANTINDTWQNDCTCAGQLLGPYNGGQGRGDAMVAFAPPPLPDCPLLFLNIGDPCDDGNASTGNDTVDGDCNCVGQLIDCEGVAGGGALPGTACNDGNPATGNDVYQADCTCAGQLIDCLGLAGGGALPGTACDDGNPATGNDTWDATCTCVGIPTAGPCTTDLFFVYAVGADPQQVTWTVYDAATSGVAATGGVFSTGIGSVPFCLPNGSFYLRVTDSGSDGIAGGYVLRTVAGQRIIDNTDNFLTGGLSAIANDGEFELPLGDDRPIFTSCDKTWWRSGEFLVARENPAVSARWTPGPNNVQDPTSGYEFWFYNANGGYSFRRFRGHHESDGYANVGATRSCHVRLNNWAVVNHLPEGILLNVKVRGVVAGVPQNWGPACRFTLDNALAACPPTKLMDIPGHPQYSCGEIRSLERGQRVYARPVRGATHYQWRFRVPAEEPVIPAVTVTTNVFHVQLNTLGLRYGTTYEVEVRASKNGTVSWCGTGNQDPAVLSPKWGDVCLLTIAPPMTGPEVEGVADEGGLRLWPNPNRGDQLWLSIPVIPSEHAWSAGRAKEVTVDLYDISGKRMLARVLPVLSGAEGKGEHLKTVIDINGDLAGGTYVVRIVAGDKVYTERLVVQP